MTEKTDAPKIEPPMTLEHLDQHLHEMKCSGERNLVFGFGISVVAIGTALLIKSRSDVDIDIWLWALIIGIGLVVMIVAMLSQRRCKKSK